MSHAKIKKLVKSDCSLYEAGRECPLTGGLCVYYREAGALARCAEFEKGVLPLDPALKLWYTRQHQGEARGAGHINECIKCGKSFIRSSNRQKYCVECQPEAIKELSRQTTRRYRAKKKGLSVTL